MLQVWWRGAGGAGLGAHAGAAGRQRGGLGGSHPGCLGRLQRGGGAGGARALHCCWYVHTLARVHDAVRGGQGEQHLVLGCGSGCWHCAHGYSTAQWCSCLQPPAWLWPAAGLGRYERDRGFADGRCVTRLSPFLHWGQLSPRLMLHRLTQANCKQVWLFLWRWPASAAAYIRGQRKFKAKPKAKPVHDWCAGIQDLLASPVLARPGLLAAAPLAAHGAGAHPLALRLAGEGVGGPAYAGHRC